MPVAEIESIEIVASQHSLERERDVLQKRLEEGFFKIERALESGQDVGTWEQYWIELLHKYELVCAEIEAAA